MTFVILTKALVTTTEINLSNSKNIDEARASSDDLKVVLEFDENNNVASDVFKGYQWYTISEIRDELQKEEWIIS